MRKLPLIAFLSAVWIPSLLAQVSNDECATPIVITDVTAFCSPAGAYTNVGATPSPYSPANCFGTTTQNDVWFTFTPTATDVTITVRGATTGGGAGGTLRNPQVSLYLGVCSGTLNELGCDAGSGSNVAELYEGGLFVGTPYLIRIQGGGGQTGTFQVCINNYNPPVEPTSDCPTSSVLCDKSAFVVKSVTGAGSNNQEMEDASCFDNGAPGLKESNSTWFVWTCSKSGPLEFTLTPLNAPDDLDFVLYRLPNGIGNCQGKQVVRCMASGLSGNQTFPSPCLGPTGLRAGDTDTSEDAGCSEANDNAWLAPFNMVQGETYALVVNNFSSTGNGFAVEFGGTGEFLGPEAKFTTKPPAVCFGTAVEVEDASIAGVGTIKSWRWSFGANAVPQTATGKGPHRVQFNQPGTIPVVMTLETSGGCKVTQIQNVTVFPDVEVDTVIAAPDCNGTTNGAVEITNIKMGTPPYQYQWNGGPFTTNNKLNNLGVGVVSLVIRDANNCETSLTIPVEERKMTVKPEVTPPLCNGQSNGVITFTPTNGVAPYRFDWGSGYAGNNRQDGFKAGTYTIQGIDAVNCKGTFTVTITDHPALTLDIDTTGISCNGAADGSASATAGGGVGSYRYAWSDGKSTQKASPFPPGNYTLTVTDANGCTIVGNAAFVDPEDVSVELLDVIDLLCNGLPQGEIKVQGNGGRPPYQYSVDGKTFGNSPNLTGLAAGDYIVTLKDARNCTDSLRATIDQPPALFVRAYPRDTTVNLGYEVTISSLTGPAGRPVSFMWTPADGLDAANQSRISLQAVRSQIYVVKITDQDGCMAFDSVLVRVKDDRPVYIPNVFMPDVAENFTNSRFTVFAGPAAEQAMGIEVLRVFDRWGDLVWEGRNLPLNDPTVGWDGTYQGKPLMGVFAYYTIIRFVDNVERTYDGNVTILR